MDQRASNRFSLARVLVNLFQSAYDEPTNRRTSILRPSAESIVERFGNIDCRTDRHDMIMSQKTVLRKLRRFGGRTT